MRHSKQLVVKNSGKAARFVLIVQHDHGNDAKILFAGVTLRNFALQVLQEAVSEAVEGALAAGIFLAAVAAVRTRRESRRRMGPLQRCGAGGQDSSKFPAGR